LLVEAAHGAALAHLGLDLARLEVGRPAGGQRLEALGVALLAEPGLPVARLVGGPRAGRPIGRAVRRARAGPRGAGGAAGALGTTDGHARFYRADVALGAR